MTTSKIQVTTEQVNKLLADLRALPDTPVGAHLSDDEFIGYTMEAFEPPEIKRLDTHLASCPECATEMERLVEAAEGWDEERLAHLRERALTPLRGVPPEPSQPRKVPWKRLQTALENISIIGWQVPVASVAGILVGIALTLMVPRLVEQDGMQAPMPPEQGVIRGEHKGGQSTGECELTLDITALPAAEEWLKRIAEDVVQGRVDEAVNQLEVFRCYYPDYKQSPSDASPQPETQ